MPCPLTPHHNCWNVSRAQYAQIFIDAADYFAHLRRNLLRAKRRIYFLGWDFHSQLDLVPDGVLPEDDAPRQLAELLRFIAERNPSLEIKIVAWDFTTFYLPVREAFQKYKFQGLGRSNIEFIFDGQHPLGSSHHQKLVVIDHQLAYCGGLDLTQNRWDTPKHKAKNPRRKNPKGETYPPFHDVQLAVTGETAHWLGVLAETRWSFATGRPLGPFRRPEPGKASDFDFKAPWENVPAAISLTAPAFREQPEVRQIETLYVEQIEQAKKYIYIENQYLTSLRVAEALEESLAKKNGPQVMIVVPKRQSDVLAKYTMGVLSVRIVKRLRLADRHKRLVVCYPDNDRLPPEQYPNVHAKLMIVDGQHLRVGSANINNRSMGLDTECDITLDASGNSKVQDSFERQTATMIAHHFDGDTQAILQFCRDNDWSFRKLLETVEMKGPRTLKEFATDVAPSFHHFAEMEVSDLNQPTAFERTADQLLVQGFDGDEFGTFLRIVPVSAITTMVTGLVTAYWKVFGSMPHTFDIPLWGSWQWLGSETALMPLAIIFALSGLLILPYAVVIVCLTTLIGPWAWPYLVAGSAIAALTSYGFGYIFGRLPGRLPGRWLPLVEEKLARDFSFWSVYWARFFPFAPFGLVGLLIGRNRHPFGPYLAGTMVGIIPYLTAVVTIQSSLIYWLEKANIAAMFILVSCVAVTLYVMRRLQKRFALNTLNQMKLA